MSVPACKEYERWWVNPDSNVGWCVDAHLTDRWLTSLNRLRTLKLTSICEGHQAGDGLNQQEHPMLRLRVRPEFIPSVRAVWRRDPHKITDFVRASIESSITSVRVGWSEVEDDVFYMDLDCKRQRESEEMEPWVADWFDAVLSRLRIVDERMIQY